MPHRRKQLLLLAGLLVTSYAATLVMRAGLEPEASARGKIRDPAWLPSGRVLRVASLGQRLVLADLYWLQAVQYVGETMMAKAQRWDALYPLTDIATDLDPRFGYAYQVSGSNLAGLAHRYDEADRILEKGMRAVPNRWSLPFVYASNKFLFEHQYAVAAEYARRAAEIGKKPELALLAANLSALANTSDEYRAALAFLDQMLSVTDDQDLRAEFTERRTKISTYQALSTLETAVADFTARHGKRPASLDELVPSELAQLPADPSGGRLVYDARTGEVRSTVIGPRAPLNISEPAP
jgi:tetratricopeptide (TPR) repeat protein